MNLDCWLRVLACPACRGRLNAKQESLSCNGCGAQYPIRNNIVPLVPASEVGRLDTIANEYRKIRIADGWRPMTPAQKRVLPDAAPAGYAPLYWRVRRQSFGALTRALARHDHHRNVGIAADIGAGTGWLAFRLTAYGYRTVALDASTDEDFGLGGCDVYTTMCQDRLIAVRGDLAHLPFQSSSLHLVVFNASLHYADDLHATLTQAQDVLAPNGLLVVMDTPVSFRPKRGRRLGSRHLAKSELHGALKSSGLSPRWLPISRGIFWWLHQIQSVVRGRTPFTLPLVVASREGESAGMLPVNTTFD
jgi:SAM-dependent methyltransferase/uncharacterized protein YbaR (Trm112 family)